MPPVSPHAPLPVQDIEYRLAHALLGNTNGLDRAVVTALVGRPRRYSELKPLLDGKAENNLTMALDRLRRDGIIAQTVNARRRPPVKTYMLSELGVLVVFVMNQMVPAHESIEALRRGRVDA
jgi:DNA-binding HxlR family transcriptional regulator